MSEPSVRVSGTVLASLMFQHVNSDSDVEGLVLGESSFHEQVTISDSQSDHIHIEEIYNLQKHVACHRLHTLYSSSGEVNLDVLHQMLADNKQDSVIGWYRQRRHSEQHMTFREKLVHEKMKSALKNPHMIFLLLTSSRVTPTDSTHRIEYSAFTSRSRRFMNIPVLVTNLGLLEQQGYWKVSAPCSASGYSLIMKKHGYLSTRICSNKASVFLLLKAPALCTRSRFFCSSGLVKEVDEMNKMNDSLQAELQKVCREVEESERAVEVLQAEVSALRRSLREKQHSSAREAAGTAIPAPPKNNQLLLEAVRALLGSSPLFLTQTLNPQAFPVPHKHLFPAHSDPEPDQGPLVQDSCGKKQRETLQGRGRKRRRNNC
ncbi:BRCA1-A complex subunit Abraxas 1 isoform 1-T1 [Fundulus diaphanus]